MIAREKEDGLPRRELKKDLRLPENVNGKGSKSCMLYVQIVPQMTFML